MLGHVGHDATGVLPLGQQEVVLPEDAGGHPPQDQAHLGPGGPAGGSGQRPLQASGVELLEDGVEQAPERRHVVVDPARPVDDEGAGAPGGRVQAGGLDHQGLGARRGLGEVGLELGHGGGVERPGPGGAQ